MADKYAKDAAGGVVSERDKLPDMLRNPLPRSVTTLKETYRKVLQAQHAESFRQTDRYRRLRSIDRTAPSKFFWKLSRDLERRRASVLIQLRTGHAPLNAHLHRINRSDTSLCPRCAEGNETVIHLLLHCPAHREARGNLRRNLPYHQFNLRDMLSNAKCFPQLWTFLDKTGRFTHQHGSLAQGRNPPPRKRKAERKRPRKGR